MEDGGGDALLRTSFFAHALNLAPPIGGLCRAHAWAPGPFVADPNSSTKRQGIVDKTKSYKKQTSTIHGMWTNDISFIPERQYFLTISDRRRKFLNQNALNPSADAGL